MKCSLYYSHCNLWTGRSARADPHKSTQNRQHTCTGITTGFKLEQWQTMTSSGCSNEYRGETEKGGGCLLSSQALLSLPAHTHHSRVGMRTVSMPYWSMHLWCFGICFRLVFKDDSDWIIGVMAIKHAAEMGRAGKEGDTSTCTSVRAAESKRRGRQHCKDIISEHKHASYVIHSRHLL